MIVFAPSTAIPVVTSPLTVGNFMSVVLVDTKGRTVGTPHVP